MRLPRLIVLAAFVAVATLASAATAKRYVVSDHGAIGDGTTVNTQALQSLIDKCAADGGGVIVVPKGTFVSGALFFKQGVDLVQGLAGGRPGEPAVPPQTHSGMR